MFCRLVLTLIQESFHMLSSRRRRLAARVSYTRRTRTYKYCRESRSSRRVKKKHAVHSFALGRIPAALRIFAKNDAGNARYCAKARARFRSRSGNGPHECGLRPGSRNLFGREKNRPPWEHGRFGENPFFPSPASRSMCVLLAVGRGRGQGHLVRPRRSARRTRCNSRSRFGV